MRVFWRSVVFFVLIDRSAADLEDSGPEATPVPTIATATPEPTPEPTIAAETPEPTPEPTIAAATPEPTPAPTVAAGGSIWPAPRADCNDHTGKVCCDVNGNETNAECWSNMKWAKEHMGEQAHLDWYKDWGVTKDNAATLSNAQMQCVLWEIAKVGGDLMDKYPSSNHHCPRPCVPATESDDIMCIAGATPSPTDAPEVEVPVVTEAPTLEPPVSPTDAPAKEEDENSLSIPLWAIILISLVAIGAIIAGVIFYLSNDKSPQKKKKKRGITTPAPPKKAPEQEPPAPVVATAAPIYTTAAPLTYTAAAPVSASSFVYAPQPMITTGVPGSVYQAGPVVTHATPIATSQPIYQLQPGGASVM